MTDTADPPSPRSRVVTWHDPHEIVAGLAGRNGLEFIQALASGELPAAPILATIGDVRIVSATKGEVVLELEPAEYQYNPIGSVHGGAYATILDSACGCVVQTMLPEGVGYTSLDLSVKFI
ncbi:MAG: PaaI family thioesterase, partial [Lapillicoccus sp.]